MHNCLQVASPSVVGEAEDEQLSEPGTPRFATPAKGRKGNPQPTYVMLVSRQIECRCTHTQRFHELAVSTPATYVLHCTSASSVHDATCVLCPQEF